MSVVPDRSLRIATIDRDTAFLRSLSECVVSLDWILMSYSGPVGGETLLEGHPDALLVDVALLGPHWDSWVAHQSEHAPRLGILICTGRSTLRQRVRGLRAGADDWITKPCHVEEVAARIFATVRVRRQHGGDERSHQLRSAELKVRPELFDAFVDERAAGLTRREFDVLLALALHAGDVLGREQLYHEVWGFTMVRGDRSVDTFVRKIRVKLRRISPGWRYIHTHKGAGYRFVGEPLKRARRP